MLLPPHCQMLRAGREAHLSQGVHAGHWGQPLFMCSVWSARSCLTSTPLTWAPELLRGLSQAQAWQTPPNLDTNGLWSTFTSVTWRWLWVTAPQAAVLQQQTSHCGMLANTWPGSLREHMGMKSKQCPEKPECTHQRQLCQLAWPNPDHSSLDSSS